jgi:hypothetical protein
MIDKEVWHPIHPNKSSLVGEIVPCKMFVKKKFDEQRSVKWKRSPVISGPVAGELKRTNSFLIPEDPCCWMIEVCEPAHSRRMRL